MLLSWFNLCLGLSLAYKYKLKCPDESQWAIRGRVKCVDPTKYFCLWDGNALEYIEGCKKADFTRSGERFVWFANFDSSYCPKDVYQPYHHWTNESSGCTYKKSLCNEEGQVVYDDTDNKRDSKCTCDYTEGYDFITKPNNPCYCIPAEEDCSCYLNPCLRHGSKSESGCKNNTLSSYIDKCGPLKNISEESTTRQNNETTDTVSAIEAKTHGVACNNTQECKDTLICSTTCTCASSGYWTGSTCTGNLSQSDDAFIGVLYCIVFIIIGSLGLLHLMQSCHVDYMINNVINEKISKGIKDTGFGRCTECNIEPSVYWCYGCDAALCAKCQIDHLKSKQHHVQHVQDKYTLDYTFNVNDNVIYDIKLVSDGLLCVADYIGEQLVTVDITSREQQSISLPGTPFCITVVDNSTVAVTLPANTKVVMVDIRQGHIIKHITVKERCKGIMYSNNQLFVGCDDNTIKVLSMSGEITNTIQLSFIPKYMCGSDDGSIYCTDRSKLYCIDTEGKILFTFTHPDMDRPCSITTDDTGHVLVVCRRSNNILSFSPDGKQCQVIVKHIPDISRLPPLICYIPQSKSLVVGENKTIDVYKPC